MSFQLNHLHLETYLGEQRLGVATGFAVKKNESYSLITNWHVVTGRNPFNNLPLSATGIADPNMLKVWFHGQNLGNWTSKEIALINEARAKLWLEHERREQVDVVAVPFAITEDIKVYEIARAWSCSNSLGVGHEFS